MNSRTILSLSVVLVVVEGIFFIATDHPVLHVLVSAAFTCGAFFLDCRYITCMILFFLPNQRLVTIPGTEFSLINLLILALVVKNFAACLNYSKSMIGLCLMTVSYAMITGFFTEDMNRILLAVKPITLFLALSFVFEKNARDPGSFNDVCCWFFVVGVLAASLLALFFDPDSLSAVGPRKRFAAGEFNNPNIFGFDISFAISLLLVRLSYTSKQSTPSLIAVTVLFVFGLLTQSRAFVASALLMSIVYAVTSVGRLDARRQRLILGVTVFAALATLLLTVFDIDAVSPSIDRIVNPRRGDISGQRLDYWSAIISYFQKHPSEVWFGVSAQGFRSTAFSFVAHNAVLEVIVHWGVVGCALFTIFFFNTYATFAKQRGAVGGGDYLRYLPLLVLLLSSVTGHMFVSNPFIVKFYISVFTVYCYGFANRSNTGGESLCSNTTAG